MVSRSETFSINSMMSTQSSTANADKKKKSGLKALYKKFKPGGGKSKEQDSTAELDTLREELSAVEEERQSMQRELTEVTLLREQLQLERDQLEQDKQTLSYSLDVHTSRCGPRSAAPAARRRLAGPPAGAGLQAGWRSPGCAGLRLPRGCVSAPAEARRPVDPPTRRCRLQMSEEEVERLRTANREIKGKQPAAGLRAGGTRCAMGAAPEAGARPPAGPGPAPPRSAAPARPRPPARRRAGGLLRAHRRAGDAGQERGERVAAADRGADRRTDQPGAAGAQVGGAEEG